MCSEPISFFPSSASSSASCSAIAGMCCGAVFALSVVSGAIFLSFSRGAWGIAALAAGLAVLLAFLTSRSVLEKARIIAVSLAGLAALIALLMVILSVDEVRDLFCSVSACSKAMTCNRAGASTIRPRRSRCCSTCRTAFGPYQFRYHFPEDPHNVYINGFASYGWLGGFAYLALTLATLLIGWRAVFMRTSLQPSIIAAWSTLFFLILQGFTIDTDHWRHYYVLLGLIWGLHAAALREIRR